MAVAFRIVCCEYIRTRLLESTTTTTMCQICHCQSERHTIQRWNNEVLFPITCISFEIELRWDWTSPAQHSHIHEIIIISQFLAHRNTPRTFDRLAQSYQNSDNHITPNDMRICVSDLSRELLQWLCAVCVYICMRVFVCTFRLPAHFCCPKSFANQATLSVFSIFLTILLCWHICCCWVSCSFRFVPGQFQKPSQRMNVCYAILLRKIIGKYIVCALGTIFASIIHINECTRMSDCGRHDSCKLEVPIDPNWSDVRNDVANARACIVHAHLPATTETTRPKQMTKCVIADERKRRIRRKRIRPKVFGRIRAFRTNVVAFLAGSAPYTSSGNGHICVESLTRRWFLFHTHFRVCFRVWLCVSVFVFVSAFLRRLCAVITARWT